MERLNISKKEAEQVIRKEDRRRADNYRYYTGRVWGQRQMLTLHLIQLWMKDILKNVLAKLWSWKFSAIG